VNASFVRLLDVTDSTKFWRKFRGSGQVSEAQIKLYFEELTGQSLTAMKTIQTPKGMIYVAETPNGNFNLRNFDSSGTGAKWTVDLPASLAGKTGKGPELKFK
jgi:hypothetical protein